MLPIYLSQILISFSRLRVCFQGEVLVWSCKHEDQTCTRRFCWYCYCILCKFILISPIFVWNIIKWNKNWIYFCFCGRWTLTLILFVMSWILSSWETVLDNHIQFKRIFMLMERVTENKELIFGLILPLTFTLTPFFGIITILCK